jgi:hypothetical protein
MAGILKVDRVQSDSNLAFQIGSSNVAYFNTDGINMTGNQIITGNGILRTTSGMLYANSGIAFPASQSSSADPNVLDDYEEGTWTPNFAGSSSNPSVTQSTQSYGSYTKIGRIVYATFHMHVTAVSSQGSGNLRISGLPYSQLDNASVENGAVFYQGSAFGFTGLGVLTARGISSTQILISSIDSNGSVGTRNTGTLTTGYISGSYTYLTN